jgi:hypothetical protein
MSNSGHRPGHGRQENLLSDLIGKTDALFRMIAIGHPVISQPQLEQILGPQ